MSLATTCPKCRTSFRVVVDLLKLHGGRVRCGNCQTVFSALDQLRSLEEEPARIPAVDPLVPAIPREDEALLPEPAFRIGIEAPGVWTGMQRRHPIRLDDDIEAPGLFRMPPERQDASLRTEPDDSPRLPAFDAPEIREVEPERLPGGERDDALYGEEWERDRPTGSRAAAWAAVLLLLVVLLVQGTLAGRDWLSARFPVIQPVIAAMAAPIGLEVRPPRSLDHLQIASFELQPSSRPEFYAVSAILRNQARYPVRWPSMQLTLTDASNRVIARRIVDPADYLGTRSAETGVRARSEQPIRIALETDGVRPAGYLVTLFYR